MARNIEIKARVLDPETLEERVRSVATEGPFTIHQDDTFFQCESGRLKLRDFGDGSGELIYYRRANRPEPRESFYLRSATSSPGDLREVLTLAYGSTGRVVKRRTLYFAGRTRVHLDRVVDLGAFVELEVVLRADESASAGIVEAREIMSSLGIGEHELVSESYVELQHQSVQRDHR